MDQKTIQPGAQAAIAAIQLARSVGVPRDQAETFLGRGYVPLEWQWLFHSASRQADKDDGPTEIGAGGARGPGKSHGIFSQATLDDCQRVAGLKGLFLRKTGISAQESFDDLVQRVLRQKVVHTFNYSTNVLKFPNGSRLLLGGFKDDKDIDKYIGVEYDFIVVEELNQLTEDKYLKLLGSLRTSKPNWRPRVYASFNPGGRGHGFVKERFIIPFREGKQVNTRFFPATYKLNPYLNKEYTTYLEGLGGDLGKAWREGDFDLFEGQYFNEWSPTYKAQPYHVIPHEDPMPGNKVFIGIDWGYYPGWFAAVWFEILHNRRLYAFREAYWQRKHAYDSALQVMRMSREPVAYIKADPSIWAKRKAITGVREDPPSIGEEFIRAGIPREVLQPANNDRINGWNQVRRYLSRAPDGMPWMVVSERCKNLIRVLPNMIHDENNPEDMETDEVEDHLPDALRYGIMSRPFRSPGGDVRERGETLEDKHAQTFMVDAEGNMPNIYSEMMTGDQDAESMDLDDYDTEIPGV